MEDQYGGGYGGNPNRSSFNKMPPSNFSVLPPNMQGFPNKPNPFNKGGSGRWGDAEPGNGVQQGGGGYGGGAGGSGGPGRDYDSGHGSGGGGYKQREGFVGGGGGGSGGADRSGGGGGGYGGGSYGGDRSPGGGGNFGHAGGNKSGFNNPGFGGNDMVTQEDTIFVAGMDASTTEQDIQDHFGAIGIIKKDKKTMRPRIWLYKHKETGLSKGEATVTYDDANAAQSAISWFDGRDFQGREIRVSLAQRQNNWSKGGGRGGFGGGRGGGSGGGGGGGPPGRDRSGGRTFEDRGNGRDNRRGGGGGPPMGGNSYGGGEVSMQSGNFHGGAGGQSGHRGGGSGGEGRSGGGGGAGGIAHREGDWVCSDCKNTNFAWRNECNRCKIQKAGGGGQMSGLGGSGGGRRDVSHDFHGGSGGGGGEYDRGRPMARNDYGGSGGGHRDGGKFGGGAGGALRNKSDDRNRQRPY